MRARSLTLVLTGLAALVAFGPARADDIIYFTNGTSMAVRSHKVEKDMIRVDLGANATMAFPTYMVEKVESSGRPVFTNPAYVPSNQAIAGVPDAGPPANRTYDTTQTGVGGIPSYARARRRGGMRSENQSTFTGGEPVRTTTDGLPVGPAAGRIKSAVRSMERFEGDPLGSYRRGNTLVIDPSASPESSAQTEIIGLGPKGSLEPAEANIPPPEPADEQAPPADEQPPQDGADQGQGDEPPGS